MQDRLGQSLRHHGFGDDDFLGHAIHQIAAFDLHRHAFAFGRGHGGANFLFHTLGGGFADQQVFGAAQIIDDAFVHTVAAHPHRARIDDAAQRQHRDFRRAAADINHHRARRLIDRQTSADRGGHGLFDQMHGAGAGGVGRFQNGAPLNGGGAGGHADHDLRRDEGAPVMHSLNEVLDHLFGDFEVRDDAIPHRADGGHVAGRFPQHLLGFVADGVHDLAPALIDEGDDGRLIEDNASPLCVNKGVGRAQIDRQIRRNKAQKASEHSASPQGSRPRPINLSARHPALGAGSADVCPASCCGYRRNRTKPWRG